MQEQGSRKQQFYWDQIIEFILRQDFVNEFWGWTDDVTRTIKK